jgi:hypothetical protein
MKCPSGRDTGVIVNVALSLEKRLGLAGLTAEISVNYSKHFFYVNNN